MGARRGCVKGKGRTQLWLLAKHLAAAARHLHEQAGFASNPVERRGEIEALLTDPQVVAAKRSAVGREASVCVLRQRCPISRSGSALAPVMRHSATPGRLRTRCGSGRPTERSQRRRPRPHQANCELDPTLLSPMVEPTERSQNRGMAPPLPPRIGPVEFGELGGWVIPLLSNARQRSGRGGHSAGSSIGVVL